MSAIQLLPMQCVRCKTPLPAQVEEVFWVCANCGQGQLISDDQGLVPQVVRYATGILQNSQGRPVWVVEGQVSLQRETFGISIFDKDSESSVFWAQPRRFFIPAFTLPVGQLIDVCINMLRQPPVLQESTSPAAFLPVTIHKEDLQPLIEFVIYSIEAGRSDSMKQLGITLNLGEPELWIVP